MTRLLLFDVDQTLVRTLGAGRHAMMRGVGRLLGVENPTEALHFDGRTDRGIFLEALERHGAPESMYAAAIEAYLEELPTSLRATDGAILPGVSELLDALETQTAAVGLATGNVQRGAQLKLGHFGLWDRFLAGGFGDDSIIRSEVVQRGVERLAEASGAHADPRQTVVIGDTPLDVEAARAVGARCLAVATGSYDVASLEEAGADWALEDLSNTAGVLERLLG